MALVATLESNDTSSESESIPQESVAEESKGVQSTDKAQETAEGVSVEELAKELGWTPKDDFKGNKDDYVDAATYIRRSKDITEAKNNQIGSLKKQLKDISAVVNELKTHNERVYRTEVRRLEGELNTLKAERRVAISDGDVDKVEEIEKKINELHTDANQALNDAKGNNHPDPDSNTDWVEWKKSNGWYGEDDEMTQFADNFAKRYEGVDFKRVLKIVRTEVERVFPEKFDKDDKPSNKAASNPVEPGTRKAATKTRFTKADLTPAQRAIMGKFVRQGVMTEEAYIKDLATMGELK